KLPVEGIRLQPWRLDGVLEFPVSAFEDYPGHLRHAQVCACSLSEMTRALELAWRNNWSHFTILLHTFELVKGRLAPDNAIQPDWINLRRFEGLCAYLSSNRDRFRTAVYSEVDPASFDEGEQVTPVKTGVMRTAWRIAEQAWGKVA